MFTENDLPHNYQEEVKKYFRPKVREGIDFLNQEKPKWRTFIKKEYLKMQRCDACILGQTFGDYFDAIHDFEEREMIPEDLNSDQFAASLGFYIHETRELREIAEKYDLYQEEFDETNLEDTQWFLLGQTWIEELNKRNGQCATSPELPS